MGQPYGIASRLLGAVLLVVPPVAGAGTEPLSHRLTAPAVVMTWAEMLERDAARPTAAVSSAQTPLPPPTLPDGEPDLPLPAGESLPTQFTVASESQSPLASPPDLDGVMTPIATKGFRARSDTGSIPPDTDGAAGPNHLLVALNGRVTIQDRDGNQLSDVTLNSFWSNLGVSDTFDPKVIFDPNSQRFLFVACAQRRSAGSSMVFAVSAGTDPSGTWYKYRLDGDASNLNWVDYPNIGVNNLWVTFTANMFTISGDSFAGVNVWAVDKSSVLSGGALTSTLFFRTNVKWWEINPITGAVIQSGFVDDPTAGMFYYYPSIAVNQFDEILIGFSGSGIANYVGAYYAYRSSDDPVGTMQDVVLLKDGENPYYKTYSGTRNRWGDYSMTMVDPVDDSSFWTIQEYAYTPANQWSTWWGYIPRNASNTLTIVSPYAMADPPVGVHTYARGTSLTASITNTALVTTSTRTASLVSTGWVGTGSAPASGITTNTGSFSLNEDSAVTWAWAVSNLWVSNQTVTATVTEDALGTITAGDGYAVDPAGDVTLEAGARVRLTPGFHAETGSTVRISISQP